MSLLSNFSSTAKLDTEQLLSYFIDLYKDLFGNYESCDNTTPESLPPAIQDPVMEIGKEFVSLM